MATPPDQPSMATWGGTLAPSSEDAAVSLATLDPFASTPDAPASPEGPVSGPVLPERYTWKALLGRGGMGEVHRVHDAELGRDVALKVLYGARSLQPEAWADFLQEARLTARLQHPGIIPVYDIGVLDDGRTWYTMREVAGETLSTAWSSPPADPPELRRRVTVLARVCEAVGYAHEHTGAVHRDLKPDNVMRGPFGEVLVLDWGLALLPTDDGQGGRISGTPAYMAPEQALSRRDLISPATDVWALGSMLATAITGQPPHTAASVPALLARLQSQPEPPPCPSSDPDVEALWRVVTHALQPDPRHRPPDGFRLSEAITGWLDGSARRAGALQHVHLADQADTHARQLRARAAARRREAEAGLQALEETAPEALRRPFWDQEDEASALLDRARDAEDEATHLLRTALMRMPGLPEAMDRLADRFQAAHADAEARADHRTARRLLSELRAHDSGRHAAYIQGGGRLSLRTTPVSARVTARPFVRRGRRLVPGDPLDLGQTPLHAVPIPHGSWLLSVQAPGRAPGLLPIVVRRGEHVGQHLPPVPLPHAHRLGPHDVYVPPGWFVSGGSDPIVDRPLPRLRRYAPALVAKRFPFTLRETLSWFQRLHEEGRGDRALQFCPRAHRSSPGALEGAAMGIGGDGVATLLPDQDGDLWDPDWPALMVTWPAAAAICEDTARWSGLPWRLPGELEWEWLARGADGRALPWGGSHVDPSWCRHRLTGPVPLPAPVDAHPIDVGPSGIRGLAGNVMEWCLEDFPSTTPASPEGVLEPGAMLLSADTTLKSVRGGAYSFGTYHVRSTIRRVHTARNRYFDVGFRPVRSLVPEDTA